MCRFQSRSGSSENKGGQLVLPERDIVVGLDIGTSRVSALIAEYNEEGELCFAGAGSVASQGLRKGVVVNIEAAQQAIAKAIEAAEQEAGRTVHDVYTAVTSGNVEGLNSRGVVAVSGKGREVTQQDIRRVIEAAQAIAVPMDREILHVVAQHYMVDDKVGIRNPIDMIGVRLEADVHIVTGSIAATQNVIKCANRSGYKVNEISLESLVGSQAVLSEDEKELGVLYLDIGGGTSDAIVYLEGTPHFSGSLPVAGEQVTTDLSIVLEQSMEQAEMIKLSQAKCWEPLVDSSQEVLLPGIGGRPPRSIPELDVCRITQSRMAEILLLIRKQLQQKGYMNRLGGGIVLAGGGALLPGVGELASDIFQRPVRIALPSGMKNLPNDYRGPEWTTVIGLVMAAHEADESMETEIPVGGQAWTRLKEWFSNFI
ncbi:cell division protein FtsA [Oceanispirochaeta sp. M1]|nr:cell division protein FtsA [Oceanispirochaeta sp. M1]